jgi:flagellar protein FlaI
MRLNPFQKVRDFPDKDSDKLTISRKPKNSHDFLSMTAIDILGCQIETGVAKSQESSVGMKFLVIEPPLNNKEKVAFEIIKKLLMTEMTVSISGIKDREQAQRRLKSKISRMVKEYNLNIPQKSLDKIIYYSLRDFVHMGKIEALMRDQMIEEISCDGVGVPIYIWHREYESMPTNIVFENEAELDTFARKLAYVSGKQVSIADPILDASLPDGNRINLTLGSEITKKGSTFTIRKFSTDPITVIDLIKYGTMSKEIAAFMWFLVEKRATMIVAGGTASGKTTTLNALSSFITPGQKVVSIEDTHELKIPHENWIPSVSRQNFTAATKVGEISQFDLLRAALRQRPDIVIVGETRGREANILFQSMSTGHGGFSSLHADSVEGALARLTSSPMDVPKALIANSLDIMTLQLKIKIGDKSVRRIIKVSEIVGLGESNDEIKTNDVFIWDPVSDKHIFVGKSKTLEKIKHRFGMSDEEIQQEIEIRKDVLDWLVKHDIRDHTRVNQEIKEFNLNAEKYYERIKVVL